MTAPLPTAQNGSRFATLVIDKSSKLVKSLPSPTKSAAISSIITALREMQLTFNETVKRYQTDGENELYRGPLGDFCTS